MHYRVHEGVLLVLADEGHSGLDHSRCVCLNYPEFSPDSPAQPCLPLTSSAGEGDATSNSSKSNEPTFANDHCFSALQHDFLDFHFPRRIGVSSRNFGKCKASVSSNLTYFYGCADRNHTHKANPDFA